LGRAREIFLCRGKFVPAVKAEVGFHVTGATVREHNVSPVPDAMEQVATRSGSNAEDAGVSDGSEGTAGASIVRDVVHAPVTGR